VDVLPDRCLEDGGDDLQRTPAVRAGLDVDVDRRQVWPGRTAASRCQGDDPKALHGGRFPNDRSLSTAAVGHHEAYACYVSGYDRPLPEFIAEKRPMKLRSPGVDVLHCTRGRPGAVADLDVNDLQFERWVDGVVDVLA
jgi:hypothetical protein